MLGLAPGKRQLLCSAPKANCAAIGQGKYTLSAFTACQALLTVELFRNIAKVHVCMYDEDRLWGGLLHIIREGEKPCFLWGRFVPMLVEGVPPPPPTTHSLPVSYPPKQNSLIRSLDGKPSWWL